MRWLLVFVLLISCQPVNQSGETKLLDVFSDFNYVGSGPAKFKQDGSLDTIYVVPHEEEQLSQPSKLERGTQYVFHFKNGTPDNEAMGLRILPERLKKLGYKILEAPNYNGGTFLYTYIGGPYFYIKFSDGEKEAIIFNQPDRKQLTQDRVVEDYVIVVLK
jgi:hypothetical protein